MQKTLLCIFLSSLSFLQHARAAVENKRSLFQDKLAWVDEQGAPVTFEKWRGKTVFLTLGYTTCKKICPLTIQKLKEIETRLLEKKESAEFVFVTIDPEVDTPESLSIFRNHVGAGEHWHFLSANIDTTYKLGKLLYTEFLKVDDHVLHKYKIWKIGPGGEIEGSLNWEHHDIKDIVD